MGKELERLSARDWVLAMLYLAGGKVRGRTRIHKGIFLVHAEVEGVETPTFEPRDYGPWSLEVDEAINELVEEGLVVMRKEPGGDESPAQVFELSEEGRKRAEEVISKLRKHPEYARIKLRLTFAAKAPLINLLAYIYGMYPKYTVRSRIKRKVSLWRALFRRY